jgi:hypothetical protein
LSQHREDCVGKLCIVLLLLLPWIGLQAKEKPKAPSGRLLTGKVLDKADNPVNNGVVYLINSQTHEVKTYIVSEDGAYHFPELSTNVDYEIYAQFKGVKSATRSVSQFDDRPQINIVLRIGK